MTKLFLDFETFSDTPISRGTAVYAADAEPILLSWAIDDGPVNVWRIAEGEPMPAALREKLVDYTVELWAHNAAFDSTVAWMGKHEFEELRRAGEQLHRWRCTMAQALSHGLPAKLEALAVVLGAEPDMEKLDGSSFIQTFCVIPKSAGRRIMPADDPEAWERGVRYAAQDIATMRWCHQRMPSWNWQRRDIRDWKLDQIINRRGFAIDEAMVEAADWMSDIRQRQVNKQAAEDTGGYVSTVTQRDKVLAVLLADHGVALPDLKASTIERRLEDPDLPEAARALLLLRLDGSRASLAKYKSLMRNTHEGRLRFGFQFRGAARTGRDAGRLFQPQNLPRPKAKYDDILAWIEAVQFDYVCGLERGKPSLTEIAGFEDLQMAQDALRSAIIAPKGKKLVQADESQIELRAAAWVGGEEWKLEALRRYDRGEGPDLYRVTAGMMYLIDADQVEGDLRQQGKVADLACLAGDVEVLTDRGFVPIAKVRADDRVHDGLGWVAHKGVLSRGVKETIEWNGIRTTADHLVLVGNEWVEAGTVASCESTNARALATCSETLRSSGFDSAPWVACGLFEPDALAAVKQRSTRTICCTERPGAVNPAGEQRLVRKCEHAPRCSGSTSTSCQTTDIGAGYSIGFRPPSAGATAKPTGTIRTTAAGVYRCARLGARIVRLFFGTSRRWMAGTTRRLKWTASTLTETTNRETSDSSPEARMPETSGASAISKRRLPTYDIACAGPRSRFVVRTNRGLLIVHNCQYGGGVNALEAMAAVYRVTFDEQTKKDTVDRWRRSNSRIRAYWYELEEAIVTAIHNPGNVVSIRDGKIKVKVADGWLMIRLPSGRLLSYPQIEYDGEERQISYMGQNNYTRKWERIRSWGGKFFENIVQAIAADVLWAAIRRCEAAGWPVVLRVHDELVCEVPDSPEYTVDQLREIMTTPEPWMDGLPLAAAGWEGPRYRK